MVVTKTIGQAGLNLAYFFAFDSLAAGNSVLVSGMEPNNMGGGGAFAGGTMNRQLAVATVQRDAVTFFRQTFGAKIAYNSRLPQFANTNKQTDQVHPNINGHKAIAESIISTLTTGETVPWA